MKELQHTDPGVERSGDPAALVTTRDLLASERLLVEAMRELGFGRFEYVQIRNGQPVVDPPPAAVRDVKFGARSPLNIDPPGDFDLKRQVVELFEYTRSVDAGEIRTLEVRHGLPFSMEIETGGALGGRYA